MDITNKISYDTAGAITSINKLAVALRNYNKAVAGVSKDKGVDKTATALKDVSTSAEKAAKSTKNLSKSLSSASSVKGFSAREKEIQKAASAIKKLEKNSKGLLISWESMARIGAMQVLHQAFSAMTSSIKSATAASRELGISIAEIQTIGPEFGDFDKLSESLTELSDLSGIKVEDVTSGMYQTLSNQVTDAGHSMEFLAVAADLAIASVSSLEGAVNLLSSITNSYGDSAQDAIQTSDQLFKAVELGRFKIEDIANSYGRIAGLASEMGIGNDELTASLAALTSTGMDAAEGMTLINNTILKLIKPTKNLKGVFDKLGVSSAEAGIQAFGFQGFLVKIMETTGGTATELGQLFGRIRAVRGALGLSITTAEKYEEILKKIQNSAGATAKAKAKIFESEGKQLSTELNAIHNATLGLGSSLNSVLLSIFKLSGGGVSAMRAIAVGVTAVTISVIALKRAFIQAAFAAAASPLGLALIAIGTLAAGASIIIDKMNRDAVKAANMTADAFIAAEKKRTATAIDGSTKRTKAAKAVFREIQKSLLEQVKAEKAVAQKTEGIRSKLFSSLDSQFSGRISSVSSYFDAIKDQAKSASGAVADLKDVIAGTTATLEDYDFDIKIGKDNLSDANKLNKLISKSVELRDRSRDAAKAGHAEEAKALQQRSLSYAKQAESQAKSLKSTGALKRAQNNVRDSLKNQITLERTKAELTVKAAGAAEKELKTNDEKFRQLEQIKGKMSELSEDEFSPELGPEARAKIKAELISLAKEADQILGGIKWTKAFDNLNFRDQAKMFDMFTGLSSGMYNELTQQSTSWGDGVISMLGQIEAKFESMSTTSSRATQALFGNVSATEASKLLVGLQTEYEKLDTLTKDAIENDTSLRKSRETLLQASIKAVKDYSAAYNDAITRQADVFLPDLALNANEIQLSSKKVIDAFGVIDKAMRIGKTGTKEYTAAVETLIKAHKNLPTDDAFGVGVGHLGEAKKAIGEYINGLDDVKVRLELMPELLESIEERSKIDAKIKIATEALEKAKKDAEELNKEVKNIEEKKKVNIDSGQLKVAKEKAEKATKEVDKLDETVKSLEGKKIELEANSNIPDKVNDAQSKIDSLTGKTVELSAKLTGAQIAQAQLNAIGSGVSDSRRDSGLYDSITSGKSVTQRIDPNMRVPQNIKDMYAYRDAKEAAYKVEQDRFPEYYNNLKKEAELTGEINDLRDKRSRSLSGLSYMDKDRLYEAKNELDTQKQITDESKKTMDSYKAMEPALNKIRDAYNGISDLIKEVTSGDLGDKKIDITADTNIPEKTAEIVKDIEKITGKKVSVEMEDKITANLTEAKNKLESLPPGYDVKVSANSDIPQMVSEGTHALKSLDGVKVKIDADTDVPTKVEAIKSTLELLTNKKVSAELEDKVTSEIQGIVDNLNGITDKKVKITTESDVKEKATEVTSILQAIPDKVVKINVATDTTQKVMEVTAALSTIQDEKIKVDIKTDTGGIKEIKTILGSLASKSITVTTFAAGAVELEALRVAISMISSKSVQVTANVQGEAQVRSLKASIDALRSKTITITTIHHTVYTSSGSKAKFGRLFRSGGGDVRGTDTVPAMLTPGEFVVNEPTTKKLYSQLVAANSSSRYLGSGGSSATTFNNNFNITGSDAPQQTAREITKLLRRENRIRK